MKIKNLILLLFLAVGKMAFAQQPCWQQTSLVNPGSAGMEIRNFSKSAIISSINVGTKAWLNFNLYNSGGNTTCDIPVGKIRVIISFPVFANGTMPIIHDSVGTWNSDFFTWTYYTNSNVLIGLNRLPLAGDYSNVDQVFIPIKGNTVNTVTSSLEIAALGGCANITTDDVHPFSLAVLAAMPGLPLTINDLEGSSQNCGATAKWTTSNEINLKRFEVETSTDGVKFANVGTVNAGTLSAANAYQYSWKPTTGEKQVFYRLKIVDKDETFSYSKITPIVINCNTVKSVKVFPNPAIVNKQLNINLTGYQATAKGELLSATGQLVRTLVLKNGANSITVDNVAQGFYTLRITEAGIQTEVIKVNVLR